MQFIKKNIPYLLLLIVIIGIVGIYLVNKRINPDLNISPTLIIDNTTDSENPANPNNNSQPKKAVEILAENLKIPWEVILLSDEKYLITERVGNIVLLDKKINSVEVIPVPGVLHRGEGGLLGAALDPNFDDNKYLYLYFTYLSEEVIKNKVVRYIFENNKISEEKVVIDNIRGSNNHNGGRIAFGPDGKLYIGTGDAGVEALSQDNKVVEGKVLRINADGTIPTNNPFGNAVYSYGHRNVQGLAWDTKGDLWITEHGPSGTQSGWDEINLIKSGGNYGWPEIRGDSANTLYINPQLHSGLDDTWAPAGVVHYKNVLYFAGLRGSALYRYNVNTQSLETFFENEYGRIRAVVLGEDDMLYITTSNNDGRGTPNPGDDKLIRIDPEQL